jgi:hypothetical protein
MLVCCLNCLGKSAIGIVYYADCTVKDERFRRKEAKQSLSANKKNTTNNEKINGKTNKT